MSTPPVFYGTTFSSSCPSILYKSTGWLRIHCLIPIKICQHHHEPIPILLMVFHSTFRSSSNSMIGLIASQGDLEEGSIPLKRGQVMESTIQYPSLFLPASSQTTPLYYEQAN